MGRGGCQEWEPPIKRLTQNTVVLVAPLLQGPRGDIKGSPHVPGGPHSPPCSHVGAKLVLGAGLWSTDAIPG